MEYATRPPSTELSSEATSSRLCSSWQAATGLDAAAGITDGVANGMSNGVVEGVTVSASDRITGGAGAGCQDDVQAANTTRPSQPNRQRGRIFRGYPFTLTLEYSLAAALPPASRKPHLPKERDEAVTHLLAVFLIAVQVRQEKSLFFKQSDCDDQYDEDGKGNSHP